MRAEVRRIVPDDWPALRALRLEALADTPLAFLETLEAARALGDEVWRARAARGSVGGDAAQVVAAEDGSGRALATCLAFVSDERVWLGAVYVTPVARGHGLVAAMLEQVAAWARAQGQDALLLEVHEDNGAARRAYERLGFVPTGARRPYPLDPTREELEMRLELG